MTIAQIIARCAFKSHDETDGDRRRFHLVETLAGRLMLAGAVVFLYILYSPSLEPGMLAAGDDTIHSAYSLEMLRQFKQHGWPLNWTYIFGLGGPIFIFRPAGFYLTSLCIYLLSFGQLPILMAHKLAYMLPIVLYPLAIYYMLRKFKFSPLVCGIAALLALTPISTFGHAFDAYYNLGLAKQVVALFLLPFLIGKFHGIVANGERIFPGALLFGLTFLNHPYVGWMFCVLAGVYMFIQGIARPRWRWWWKMVSRFLLVVTAGALLISFWLVPFYSNPETQRTEDFSSGRRFSFDVAADTAAGTVTHYAKGSLFDRARSAQPRDRFGGGNDWGWKPNHQNARWPVLSWCSLVGALMLLLTGWRQRKHALLVTLWAASMLVLLGTDDVPLLRLLPFQSQFQYLHWIAVPELLVICLSAYAIYAVGVLLWRLWDWATSRLSLGVTVRALACVCLVLLCAAAPVYNANRERYKYAQGRLTNRRFELGENGQTEWSLKYPAGKQLKQCTDYLKANLSPYERFYASPIRIRSGSQIFHFTLLPTHVNRPNVISPLFGGITGGVNRLVHMGKFRHHMWKSPVMLDLLRVGAIVLQPGSQSKFPYDKSVYVGKKRMGSWIVYKARASGPCDTTQFKPTLFVGRQLDWRTACESWLERVQKMKKREELQGSPFLAWEMTPRKGKSSRISMDNYGAVVVADLDFPVEDYFEGDELAEFVKAGGHVYTPLTRMEDELPSWATDAIGSLRRLPLSAGDAAAPTEDIGIRVVAERDGYHEVEVTATNPCFLYLKVAFHRGWRVTIDGEPAPVVSLSPGYNACRVPAGRHSVQFRYAGRNNQLQGAIVSCCALLAFVSWGAWGVRKRWVAKHEIINEQAQEEQS